MKDQQAFIRYLTTEVKSRGKISHHTIEGYVRAINHLEKFLDGKQPTKASIKEFIYFIKQKYKTNSQTPIFGALRQYLRFLGWNKAEVKDLVTIPSTVATKTAEDVLSPEELQKLYNATKEDTLANTIQKCLYLTGLRRNELISLDIDDIKPELGIIVVRNGKGKNGQPEEIAPRTEVFDAIEEYLKVRPKPKEGSETALFLSPVTRKRISEDSVRRILLTAQANSGVKPEKRITPHMFRRSVATHMHNNGASDSHIMELTRHKSFTALKIYLNPSREQKKKISETYVPDIKESTPLESTAPQPRQTAQQIQQNNPMEILAQRFARGEISEVAFMNALQMLTPPQRQPKPPEPNHTYG